MRRLADLPLIVILMGIGAAAMLLPAAHAESIRDHATARAFLQPALMFLVLAAIIGIATIGNRTTNLARSHLLAMLGTYAALPLMLAVPLNIAVADTSYFNAWFEMVSSLTTTGASVFEGHDRIAPSVHLWRALVGWMGGLFTLVTAAAILAPMNLGGFEVITGAPVGHGALSFSQIAKVADPSERLIRHTATLLPIYAGLTMVLWIALLIAGDGALVALCHAMSTLATSGISPVGGLDGGGSGFVGETMVFAFLFFGLTRRMYPGAQMTGATDRLLSDPEFRMGLLCIAVVPALLFLRHWLAAFEVEEVQDIRAATKALWGTIFNVLSFLTTTGFESRDWDEARAWSGLPTSGLILAGLALVGGGVATTAGGVKLLRVYALYRHGEREIDRLIYPASIGGSGAAARRLRRQGAYVAWLFFMLFAISIAVVMGALALAGLDFESATVLTIAALSTTGPLAQVAAEAPISYATLGEPAKAILAAAMVLGRLETLAIIALLNPEFWRN